MLITTITKTKKNKFWSSVKSLKKLFETINKFVFDKKLMASNNIIHDSLYKSLKLLKCYTYDDYKIEIIIDR